MADNSEKTGKLLYSMGEVSEMFDVNPSLIRHWEGKFDILKPKKNKKGNRLFSPEDVRNLKTIYHLVKERGMTLAGAQKYMKASRHSIERDMELAERLQSIRSLLAEVRDALGTDGTVMDEVFAEPVAPEPMEFVATIEIKEEILIETAVAEEPEPDMTETHGESEPEESTETYDESEPDEDADALMQEAIAAMEDDEPEDMPDFEPEPEPTPEEEQEEEKPEEAPKPPFIEQTLFDF